MKKQHHILALVTDAFGGHGGIALYMRDVLRCVAAMEPSPCVTLLARTGQPEVTSIPDNIRWIKSALGGKLAFTRELLRALWVGTSIDMVLCGHINLLPLARLAALRSKAPLVLFIHGIDAWTPPKNVLARSSVKSTNHVSSVSEITRQRFIAWSKVSPERVTLAPNAIKLERFGEASRNAALVARYGIENKRVLLTLGRLSTVQRHKGVDEIIAVMPRLLEEFPDLVYLVAGGGDDISRLQELANFHGVAKQVIFTGMVAESEKADHYRLADAFALAGRGDGFGFVLLEAMACGIPVVASVLDGSQEAVLNGELGTLVNPDDADSLVKGLSKALRQPKGIPVGLMYFAYPEFCSRLQNNFAAVLQHRA